MTNFLFSSNFKIEFLPGSFLPGDFPGANSTFVNPFHTRTVLGTIVKSETIPTYVQKIAILAEQALVNFERWNFRRPTPSGNIHIKVSTVNGGSGITLPGDDFCTINLGNDDRNLTMTVVHELFHMIQFRYLTVPPSPTDFMKGFLEGSAVLLADIMIGSDKTNLLADFFPTKNLFLGDGISASAALPHKTAFFWRNYFKGKSGESYLNIDVRNNFAKNLLKCIDHLSQRFTPDQLDIMATQLPWFSNFDSYYTYDEAGQEKASVDVQWCNFLIGAFLKSTLLDRFKNEDDRFEIFLAQSEFRALAVNNQTQTLNKFSCLPFNCPSGKYRLTSNVPLFISVVNTKTSRSAVTAMEETTLENISTVKKKDFTFNTYGSDTLAFISTTDSSAEFTLSKLDSNTAADVHITNWNCLKGTDYEVNPIGYSWTFTSPDVNLVHKITNGVVSKTKQVGARIRNRGNAGATGVTVQFWYQPMSPYVNVQEWHRMKDSNGTILEHNNISLAAGEEKWLPLLDWFPDLDHTLHTIKVVVISDNDANPTNNVALHSAGVYKLPKDKKLSLEFNYPSRHQFGQIVCVSRGSYSLQEDREIFIEGKPIKRINDTFGLQLPTVSHKRKKTFLVAKHTPLTSPAGRKKWTTEADAYFNPANFYFSPNQALLAAKSPNLVTLYHKIDGHIMGGVTIEII